jgi:hypothetical protein
MNLAYELAFTVFPYICLTIFIVGHAYRYRMDRYSWNALSRIFRKESALFRLGSISLGNPVGSCGSCRRSADSTKCFPRGNS